MCKTEETSGLARPKEVLLQRHYRSEGELCAKQGQPRSSPYPRLIHGLGWMFSLPGSMDMDAFSAPPGPNNYPCPPTRAGRKSVGAVDIVKHRRRTVIAESTPGLAGPNSNAQPNLVTVPGGGEGDGEGSRRPKHVGFDRRPMQTVQDGDVDSFSADLIMLAPCSQ